jgi:hypothetical protein
MSLLAYLLNYWMVLVTFNTECTLYKLSDKYNFCLSRFNITLAFHEAQMQVLKFLKQKAAHDFVISTVCLTKYIEKPFMLRCNVVIAL